MSKHLLLPLFALALTITQSSAQQPPNLVFILADDLGWADTTLYGHTSFYKTPNLEGVEMTSAAFETVMPWFKMILSIAVILFAFSTMISWSYYGMQAWAFVFGNNKFIDLAYKLLFCFFVIVGASMDLKQVFNFSDAMIFAMSIPNVIGLYILLPLVRGELDDFRAHAAAIDSKS